MICPRVSSVFLSVIEMVAYANTFRTGIGNIQDLSMPLSRAGDDSDLEGTLPDES